MPHNTNSLVGLTTPDLRRIRQVLFGCAEPALYARFVEAMPPHLRHEKVMSCEPPKVTIGWPVGHARHRWSDETP